MYILLFISIFLNIFTIILSYKPVFIIHGILAKNTSMLLLGNIIQEYHPGTKVYIFNEFCGWESLSPLYHQATYGGYKILQMSALHPEGFHLIGFSQGGLLSRTILEMFPQHRVRSFISLSSPQAGLFGIRMYRVFFPRLVKHEAYKLFYSHYGQHLSVANFWNDPSEQELYYKFNKFLPVINNEMNHSQNQYYKMGITNLKKFILVGGPDDEVIAPWQSSQFGYFSNITFVENMKDRRIYQEDLFGLRTLDERGDLHIHTMSGVHHHYWYRNRKVIENFIIPYLD